MKRLILALLLVGAPFARGAANAPVTFYVQLIRGSDSDAPPSPQARSIGHKLDQRLHNIFRWKNYWEIKRETLTLNNGSTVRKRISPDREIELAWHKTDSLTISLYTHGKVTRKRTQSVGTAFYIAGGDEGASQPWFIIVCRDNPDAGQESKAQVAAMP